MNDDHVMLLIIVLGGLGSALVAAAGLAGVWFLSTRITEPYSTAVLMLGGLVVLRAVRGHGHGGVC